MASSQGHPPVIVKPTDVHTASVIFFHGLGDTGHGWAELFSEIAIPNVRYIFPTAPVAPVTLNGGMKMHSWFDIAGLSANVNQDEAGIKAASETLDALIIEEENAGIPANRIIVGGFSQGGAVALYHTLTSKRSLSGVVALSCWLPLHQKIPEHFAGVKDPHVLQCHGTSDPLVPLPWAEMSHMMIKQFLPNAVFKKYPGLMHSSCEEEMRDIRVFLENRLK